MGAVTYAAAEESFVAVIGAAIFLVLLGTVDPNLTLTSDALKLFTAFYVLTGIGILVELARQVGVGFMKARSAHSADRHAWVEQKHAQHHKTNPPETPSAE